MRVAHVSLQLPPQGRSPEGILADWSTLPDVAGAVARAGADVMVVLAARWDAVVERGGLTHRFLKVRRIPVRRGAGHPLWGLRGLCDVVSGFSADIVHVHGLSFPVETWQLTRALAAVPVVVQDHASRAPNGWRRCLYRRAFAEVAGVIVTARAQVQPFLDAHTLRPDLPVFEAIEGSTHFVPGDQVEARAGTGLGGDPCLVWLGHLTSNKDPLAVIEGFRRAIPELPDPQLWCCFRAADLLVDVEARLAGDPALARRVHLLGSRPHEQVETLLRAADFLVQGSHVEGSGYAVIEALACGTTPLITDVPSFRRITGDGAVGALSPPGDAASMAQNLIAWSRRDRPSLRAAARAHFERDLSFDAIGAQLLSIYETLVRAR